MEPLANLGMALARLRNLYGLSNREAAERIGVTVERLTAMERGEIESGDLEKIAKLYELDEEGLREGMIRPVEGMAGATIFLLQGAHQDFDDQALGVLEHAMREARSMTALAADESHERLRRRLQFVPTAPAGPRSADAARQGYKLARMVRARMNLGGEPIEDIRALLEDQLGIAVVVVNRIGRDLRAASILDVHRAAAAAVLAANHPDFRINRVLARVYLAHESCHVLFDPGSPGSVRIALDGLDSHGSAGSTVNLDALLESRAKGFAAELLIPVAGVNALLGAPAAPESSLTRARAMVATVRDHFFTPWEITVYHLGNLGFIQRELLTRDLLADGLRVRASWLPTRGGLLKRLRPAGAAPGMAAGEVPASAATSHEVPPYAREARQAAEAAIDALNADVIAKASDAVERGREIEAADLLGDHFDDLLHAGEFEAVRHALVKLDPRRFPPQVLSGVLMVTWPARDKLGKTRSDFLARVQSALADTWQVPAGDIAEIIGEARVTDSVVLHPISERPVQAAVVTVMDGAVGTHVGLLCLAADGTHRHLDLAWHLRLQDKQDPPADAFWVEPRLTKYQLTDLAFSARMIARKHQSGRIPYAFARDPEFDPQGTLQLNQGLGLTCATFVLRVFQHARIQLLDEAAWDRDRSDERKQEDIAAQRELVKRLRDHPDSRSHADLVAGEVGCTRIRAEEVAAASGMTGRPISFARAEPEGRRVLERILAQPTGSA